ncbi:hypothetical protein HZA43_00330 [Candidatus Peregrinibacteria bacterium]|nr:hypothetical protein [Candidatus Peregrinibacteria bacterium]
MKILKGIAIGIGALILLGALILGTIFYITKDQAAMADRFLEALKTGDTEKAYQMTSTEFQKETTPEAFKSFANRSTFKNYQSSTWGYRSIDTSGRSVKGVIQSGETTLKAEVDFIKENDEWKIQYFSYDSSKDEPESALSLPDDKTLKDIAHQTMLAFKKAIELKNFDEFYSSISDYWKTKTTANELKGIFTVFMEKEIRLPIENIAPILNEPPRIDENNRLVLKGSYPLPTLKADFKLIYLYEYPQWKLIGIDVNTLPLDSK